MTQIWKLNLFLLLYGLRYIPLVWFCRPKVVEATNQRIVLKIPLRKKTKNHLGVMYFGALNIGAELSIAIAAVMQIYQSKKKVDFLFKDYKVEFLKRSDGHVHFVFENVPEVINQINETIATGERVNRTLKGYAIVPSTSTTDVVANYELTLTVKHRK